MINLLEELYKADIGNEKYHQRKIFIDEKSYQITGISQSGKTKLVKNYLIGLKKNSYLYIDCNDIRLDIDNLNLILQKFCTTNKINTLVLDNYNQNIDIINVTQLILTSEINNNLDFLQHIQLLPLDYEEFLAYEHKYDSSALNHFFKLGGFPAMHKVANNERVIYMQKTLQCVLNNIEFHILKFCAKVIAQKISPFAIYERLKSVRKISKDKVYKSYKDLIDKNYIHLLEKTDHPKAIKKIYLCDISIKTALTIDKHFGRLFENMVFLELFKKNQQCFYDDKVDFYLPQKNEIILCKPFADERTLFKKLEELEEFIFTHTIKKVTAITMNKESTISHPFSKVEMIPFDIWALVD